MNRRFTKDQLRGAIDLYVKIARDSDMPDDGLVTILTHWAEGIITAEVNHALGKDDELA